MKATCLPRDSAVILRHSCMSDEAKVSLVSKASLPDPSDRVACCNSGTAASMKTYTRTTLFTPLYLAVTWTVPDPNLALTLLLQSSEQQGSNCILIYSLIDSCSG